jgi:hypothetical protein
VSLVHGVLIFRVEGIECETFMASWSLKGELCRSEFLNLSFFSAACFQSSFIDIDGASGGLVDLTLGVVTFIFFVLFRPTFLRAANSVPGTPLCSHSPCL